MANEITLRELREASDDAKSLEEVVNGNDTKQVTTRLGETYPSVKKAIKDLFEKGGLPATPFDNKDLMTASSLANGKYAVVTSDLDIEKNGYYQKTSDGWVYLDYNFSPMIKNELSKTISRNAENSEDILTVIDKNGKSVLSIKTNADVFLAGFDTDLKTDINKAATISDGSDNLFEVRDINGNITFRQDKYGDLHSIGVGNLTKALSTNKDDSSDDLSLASAHLAGKYNDYVLTELTPNYNETDYLLKADYVNGLAIFPHIVTALRIPAITRIGKTKYLLFFEARVSQDDFGEISQGVATVNIDESTNLAVVSDIKSLHNAFTDGQGKLRTFMNACAVKLDSGVIICLYARCFGILEYELYMRTSSDDGATWSEFVDITGVKGDTGWNALVPCSQGLVKRYGKHKGRVVFPLWNSGAAYDSDGLRAGYIYSDDDGLTWELGEFSKYITGNEVQAAEDLNGDMLFSIRLENRNPPHVLARLSDITKEYTTVSTNKPLTDEAIMCGLIQGENQYDLSSNKFYLTACKNADRSELLIHTSYDGGENWRSLLLPSTIGQKVGYSCIESINAKHKFVLWESDVTTNLKYAVISINNLVQGV